MSLKTVSNALDLLEYFKKDSSWGVRQLAKEMKLSPTVTHRILSTFQDYGYIVQDQETLKYELGIKFLEFSVHLQDKLKFKDVIYPYMERLVKETDETIFLALLDEQEVVSVAVAESTQSIKFIFEVGTRRALHAGSSNRVVLAYLPKDERKKILSRELKKFTDNTVTDPGKVEESLQKVREQGFCCTYGELTKDVVGIAVPLFDCNNQIVASLTAAGPMYRLPEEKVLEILEQLLKEKEDIQSHINKLGLTYSQIKKSL
ncbi:IclR family transcriptional regulator [Sporosarcina psychrophila]|uniref:IclR family transcriptional regulator n=1 Tax=Sporosarcina psychrophila TaxID=1476 RepID=UPI00078E861D|nr:IclR family transcriptional regulator [Sporosarcina psychrophila]AMQ07806.1 hypothetical protein AZE41_18695 [Sporosarcina psychrophila]